MCETAAENGVWRMRSNQELRKLHKTPDLRADVKRKRLEWVGHVIRMNKKMVVKKIFGSDPELQQKEEGPDRE